MISKTKTWIGNAVACFGAVFFVGALGMCLLQFGNHWTIGDRYYMPKSLVNETGWQHLDGTAIDGLTMAAISADIEEEVFLAFLCILGGIFALIRYKQWRFNRWMAAFKESMA